MHIFLPKIHIKGKGFLQKGAYLHNEKKHIAPLIKLFPYP
jgi:spore germination protein D